MRRSVCYIVAALVGLSITAVTVWFSRSDSILAWAILPLYTVSTGYILVQKDHWVRLFTTGRDRQSSRLRGAIGGGVAALTLSLLLQISIPAGVAGIGLLIFGQALLVADYDQLRS